VINSCFDCHDPLFEPLSDPVNGEPECTCPNGKGIVKQPETGKILECVVGHSGTVLVAFLVGLVVGGVVVIAECVVGHGGTVARCRLCRHDNVVFGVVCCYCWCWCIL